MSETKLIHIATFGKPVGLGGQIKVHMNINDYEIFRIFYKKFSDRDANLLSLEYLKLSRGKIVSKVINCNKRDCVEILLNKKIFLKREEINKKILNYYFTEDLLKCEVKDLKNKSVGHVSKIENFGAGDLIYIKKNKGKKFYIPLNKENLIDVDLKNKIIIVNPLKGLDE